MPPQWLDQAREPVGVHVRRGHVRLFVRRFQSPARAPWHQLRHGIGVQVRQRRGLQRQDAGPGSAASSQPVLTASVTVQGDKAYTATALSANGQAKLSVLDDNLTRARRQVPGTGDPGLRQAGQREVPLQLRSGRGRGHRVQGVVRFRQFLHGYPGRYLDHVRDRLQRADEPAGHACREHRPHRGRRGQLQRPGDPQPGGCRRGRRSRLRAARARDSAAPRRTARARRCRGWR